MFSCTFFITYLKFVRSFSYSHRKCICFAIAVFLLRFRRSNGSVERETDELNWSATNQKKMGWNWRQNVFGHKVVHTRSELLVFGEVELGSPNENRKCDQTVFQCFHCVLCVIFSGMVWILDDCETIRQPTMACSR